MNSKLEQIKKSIDSQLNDSEPASIMRNSQKNSRLTTTNSIFARVTIARDAKNIDDPDRAEEKDLREKIRTSDPNKL